MAHGTVGRVSGRSSRETTAPREEDDENNGERRTRSTRKNRYEDDDGDGVSTLIPYKNPKALIAYYLGVFSLIPCLGLGLGPAALILGIMGLRIVRKHPTAKGTGHAIAGIVLGSLVLLGHLGVIVMFLVAVLLDRHK